MREKYEHGTDMPKVAKGGHAMKGMGCDDFKRQAMPISYGQAGKSGCSSDQSKISSQMKHYGWESGSEY
jgi:hypothetical protein